VLTVAMLDRILHHTIIVSINGESQTQGQAQGWAARCSRQNRQTALTFSSVLRLERPAFRKAGTMPS
jgi:hypothetical protein